MDRHALIRVDLTTDEGTVVLARAWDVAGWTSPDGRTVLAVSNVDGSSAGELFDARTMTPRGGVLLPDPDTVLAWSHLLPDPLVADDGGVVATCSSPSMPPDVWHLRADAPPDPLTRSPLQIDRTRLRRPERHTVTSADGLAVPLLLYWPVTSAGASPPPAVVMLHGGPEGKSQPVLSPSRRRWLHATTRSRSPTSGVPPATASGTTASTTPPDAWTRCATSPPSTAG